MESVRFKGLRVSSTIVRKALAEGNLRVANSMLGRTYSIEGRVSHGDGFGRKINYPTANVKLRRKKVPLFGIYAVSVFLPEKVKLEGVASLGVRPTVKKDGSPLLEVYIFDFDDYIYGKKIKVEFLKKIRDEKKFDSIAEMVRQMDNDANLARRFFKQNEYYQSNKVIMKNGKL